MSSVNRPKPSTGRARSRWRPTIQDRYFNLDRNAPSVAGSLALGLALALLLAGRRLGPLVIPAALTGAGLAVAHRRHRSRAARTERLAVWALCAPYGRTDAPGLEQLLAADIAVTSAGHPGAVALARTFVRSAASDRWQLELALERLGADHPEIRGRLPDLGPVQSRRAALPWFGPPAAVVLVLLTVPVSGPLSTAGVAGATALAVVVWSELCHNWAYVPHLLASTALVAPPRASATLPEAMLAELLAELAGRKEPVLDDAAALLETMGSPRGTALALARVEAARRTVAGTA